MTRDEFLELEPFSILQDEKESFYREQMNEMTDHHRTACKAYDDICNGLNENGPYLPVSLFKDTDLKSVPDEKIIRKITSSGTTGQQVSKIYLDAETSALQQRALCAITGDFIGSRRIPMLIVDSPDVLRDRSKFTARGAGILGFSMMASKRIYALDENMNLDMESLKLFQELAKEGPTFAFGFTYMIWQYLYEALKAENAAIDLPGCHLIHGGGWKKLQNRSVSDDVFRAGLKEVCGIDSVSDYYGMAEQTGSIFMQCNEGHLHASVFSDISILDPEDFSECEEGQWGLIALDSLIPKSYPGHRLLTEDWGRIQGTDDCPCGRKGKYFEISGRIQKAEVRGCSDTFEGADATQKKSTESAGNGSLQVLAGCYPVHEKVRRAFAEQTLDFLEALSTLYMKDPLYRQYPEIYALGFWCRRAHIEKIRNNVDRQGRGLTLHIAPSNMPTMFAYSWITSLLAGNPNIVRISERTNEVTEAALKGIESILSRPAFQEIHEQNAFITFPRGDKLLEDISKAAKARVIWGGDETVSNICSIPKADECTDITFPDKYSIALFKESDFENIDDSELRRLAHLFYNDTYGADQNACSSPRTIFWLHDSNTADTNAMKEQWWNAVAEEAAAYDLQPWKATEKYRMLCRTYAVNEGLKKKKKWSNRLYVVPCRQYKGSLINLEARFGLFYEKDILSLDELVPFMEEKIQTMVSSGSNQEELYEKIRLAECEGVDRVTAIGEALDFNTVWDRKDLVEMLSCTFSNAMKNSKTE